MVALQAGQQLLAHPFLLKPQGHHGIGARQCMLQAPHHADLAPLRDRVLQQTWGRRIHEAREILRNQAGRTAQHHIRSTGRQSPEI